MYCRGGKLGGRRMETSEIREGSLVEEDRKREEGIGVCSGVLEGCRIG